MSNTLEVLDICISVIPAESGNLCFVKSLYKSIYSCFRRNDKNILLKPSKALELSKDFI